MQNIDHINKNFDHKAVEPKIYKRWVEKDYFHAKVDPSKTPYTIVQPPPNITGQLHMGHALDNSLQDVLIRFKRMQGYNALWVPGTDHASIATEAKIVEQLKKEGILKEDLGRTAFLKRAWQWKQTYGDRIVEQSKKMGFSCDWKRLRFTMDDGLSKAVETVFVNLYNKGYIYRGERMINWCPHCLTSISDAEVEFESKDSFLWHIRYPYADKTGYVIVATTRPETLFGDTAVAVAPDDERYKHLLGKEVCLPLTDRKIPVIADSYVEKEFGTGVVKITPAHDPNDFEVGKRHDLPIITVITDDGYLNEYAGEFKGLYAEKAREKIVKQLQEEDLIEKIEPYTHNVGTCYRCKTTIDPKISMQWFVQMKEMAKRAIEVVKEDEITIIPDRFSKIYLNWMENIKDWCISRQLWWGHRIPAYYCECCGEVIVSTTTPETTCDHCGGKYFIQDEDTLDTWFSSALWPFSILGWPEQTKDFNYFYPTSTLVSGYDIIFFWVARMIFSALEQTKEVPFKTVYLHGIIRDENGIKMSKSLGNGIDPLEVIEEYGADALRFSIMVGNSPGNDQRYKEEKVINGSGVINKIWNAFRFVLMNLDEDFVPQPIEELDLMVEDKFILSTLQETVEQVTTNFDKYELGIALSKIIDFIWDNFCDWYIEMIKPRLYDNQTASNAVAKQVARYVLLQSIALLHPYMPFFTEEIYQSLRVDGEVEDLIIFNWPTKQEKLIDIEAVKQIEMVKEATKRIRAIRLEMNVPVKKKAPLFVLPDTKEQGLVFENSLPYLQRLANVSELTLIKEESELDRQMISIVINGGILFIPMDELVDIKQEIERLNKEKEKLKQEVDRFEKKLSNENFVKKAPEQVVNQEKEKLYLAKDKLNKVEAQLATIQK